MTACLEGWGRGERGLSELGPGGKRRVKNRGEVYGVLLGGGSRARHGAWVRDGGNHAGFSGPGGATERKH